jgi:hypothetical protein
LMIGLVGLQEYARMRGYEIEWLEIKKLKREKNYFLTKDFL